MKTVLIQRFTKEEQEINSRLLSTFETMFSANSFNRPCNLAKISLTTDFYKTLYLPGYLFEFLI
jgi:hypothetical protein